MIDCEASFAIFSKLILSSRYWSIENPQPDLNGFENLSRTTTETSNDSVGILKDTSLENALSSDAAPFTFQWAAKQGIYKVILYAKTADTTIAGWKVICER